jgi:hypothetical protein
MTPVISVHMSPMETGLPGQNGGSKSTYFA